MQAKGNNSEYVSHTIDKMAAVECADDGTCFSMLSRSLRCGSKMQQVKTSTPMMTTDNDRKRRRTNIQHRHTLASSASSAVYQ
jgi:hypothetical protein